MSKQIFHLVACLILVIASTTVAAATSQRWSSAIGTTDSTISSSAIGFIGVFPTTDPSNSNNRIDYLIASDFRSDVIRAIRSDTGATVYTVANFGPGLGRSVVVSADTGLDFAVVTTHWGMNLQAFRPSSGAPIWSIPVSQNITCSPAISGNILAIRANATISAGTISANTNPPGANFAWNLLNFTMLAAGVPDNEIAPLLYNDNKNIFVIDTALNIYGINIANQSAEWIHVHSTSIASPNAIFFPDLKRIMFLGHDARVHSHDSDTGMTAWKLPTRTSSVCSSALFYDATRKALFFGCEDSRIVGVVNLTAAFPGGDLLFSTNTSSSPSTPFKVLSGVVYSNVDSTLYFGDDLGRLATVNFNIPSSSSPLPTGSSQNFTWTWDSSLPTSSIPATAPFTYVPVLTSAVDFSTTTPIAVLGNQRRIYAYNNAPSSPAPSSPSPTSSAIPWIPLQFDINIWTPTNTDFSPSSFISSMFATLGINQQATVYRIKREVPIGGPLYRVILEFQSQSVVNQIQGMSGAQMKNLNITTIANPTPIPSAAPLLSREIPGPLGVAIGVTCGIIAVFLTIFVFGIWKSSQPLANKTNMMRRDDDRATAHTEFSFQASSINGNLDDVHAVNMNGSGSPTSDYNKVAPSTSFDNAHRQQQLQHYQNQRKYSVYEDLLGSISGMPENLRQQQIQQQQHAHGTGNYDDL